MYRHDQVLAPRPSIGGGIVRSYQHGEQATEESFICGLNGLISVSAETTFFEALINCALFHT
jgi:hypothetical protein